MAFRLEDFKKTTRKSADGSGVPPSVYPHQIRDKKILARLEIAIRTFDTLVGKRRGEMDAQTMVDFFGDPRVARGVIACLGQFYKYQTPRFAQIVGGTVERRLSDAALTTPMRLRAHTYAHVNEAHDGFLTEAQRGACYGELGQPFGVSAHHWDTLLYLDAEDNQILTRPGAVPTPADIAALYNFHALDTPLRRATQIVLSGLSVSASDAADIRALAKSLGVKAVVSLGAGEGCVTLTDLEMSSLLPRRPGRLARCLLYLVHAFATRMTTGHADVLLGTRKFRLALGTDSFRTLGASLTRPLPPGEGVGGGSFRRRFEAAEALHKAWLKLRAQSGVNQWRLKRLPDAVVTAQGVHLPDFRLTRGETTVYLHLGGAAQIEEGPGVRALCLPIGRKPLDAASVLAQVEEAAGNLFALPAESAPAVPADVRALCDRAAATGLVRAADAQRALHLLDESPLIEWVRRAADTRVRYIPGVGLCSQELVSAITRDQLALALE